MILTRKFQNLFLIVLFAVSSGSARPLQDVAVSSLATSPALSYNTVAYEGPPQSHETSSSSQNARRSPGRRGPDQDSAVGSPPFIITIAGGSILLSMMIGGVVYIKIRRRREVTIPRKESIEEDYVEKIEQSQVSTEIFVPFDIVSLHEMDVTGVVEHRLQLVKTDMDIVVTDTDVGVLVTEEMDVANLVEGPVSALEVNVVIQEEETVGSVEGIDEELVDQVAPEQNSICEKMEETNVVDVSTQEGTEIEDVVSDTQFTEELESEVISEDGILFEIVSLHTISKEDISVCMIQSTNAAAELQTIKRDSKHMMNLREDVIIEEVHDSDPLCGPEDSSNNKRSAVQLTSRDVVVHPILGSRHTRSRTLCDIEAYLQGKKPTTRLMKRRGVLSFDFPYLQIAGIVSMPMQSRRRMIRDEFLVSHCRDDSQYIIQKSDLKDPGVLISPIHNGKAGDDRSIAGEALLSLVRYHTGKAEDRWLKFVESPKDIDYISAFCVDVTSNTSSALEGVTAHDALHSSGETFKSRSDLEPVALTSTLIFKKQERPTSLTSLDKLTQRSASVIPDIENSQEAPISSIHSKTQSAPPSVVQAEDSQLDQPSHSNGRPLPTTPENLQVGMKTPLRRQTENSVGSIAPSSDKVNRQGSAGADKARDQARSASASALSNVRTNIPQPISPLAGVKGSRRGLPCIPPGTRHPLSTLMNSLRNGESITRDRQLEKKPSSAIYSSYHSSCSVSTQRAGVACENNSTKVSSRPSVLCERSDPQHGSPTVSTFQPSLGGNFSPILVENAYSASGDSSRRLASAQPLGLTLEVEVSHSHDGAVTSPRLSESHSKLDSLAAQSNHVAIHNLQTPPGCSKIPRLSKTAKVSQSEETPIPSKKSIFPKWRISSNQRWREGIPPASEVPKQSTATTAVEVESSAVPNGPHIRSISRAASRHVIQKIADLSLSSSSSSSKSSRSILALSQGDTINEHDASDKIIAAGSQTFKADLPFRFSQLAASDSKWTLIAVDYD